ncbi:alpha-1,6-mannosyl-glycoprotein 4-beta-N-acetylglucosaminyltransferase-like isoform X2 [Dreissena polymorpha]|nr:alpha-1,6-mannosyl-glycoprotein 4-beta-N-acetylglucosaminyltransferase-like isoform X2 [Dreissena polymorpha]
MDFNDILKYNDIKCFVYNTPMERLYKRFDSVDKSYSNRLRLGVKATMRKPFFIRRFWKISLSTLAVVFVVHAIRVLVYTQNQDTQKILNWSILPPSTSMGLKNQSHSSCNEHIVLVRGLPRITKGFLTIGISTVPRVGTSYIEKTLASLHENIVSSEISTTTIVLFIASLNEAFVTQTLKHIDEKYSPSVESGLLQVVQPSSSQMYPNFGLIKKRTFNDSLERVEWRTKQNLDYAYLFAYCESLSEYFIQIEDDVITASNFIQEIRNAIIRLENSKPPWFEISFSSLGFIGKLFRSPDLCMLSKYLILFQLQKPCDLLMNDLRNIMLQPQEIRNEKSLFQHMGVVSSLPGKIQKLVDTAFKDKQATFLSQQLQKDLNGQFKIFNTSNPAANLDTSLETFDAFNAERAYLNTMFGFFWAKTPKKNDFFRIVFLKPVGLKRINIKTGHPTTKLDALTDGEVRTNNGSIAQGGCGDFSTVGAFKNGHFVYDFPEPVISNGICIVVTQQMKTWLIVSEIHIAE